MGKFIVRHWRTKDKVLENKKRLLDWSRQIDMPKRTYPDVDERVFRGAGTGVAFMTGIITGNKELNSLRLAVSYYVIDSYLLG